MVEIVRRKDGADQKEFPGNWRGFGLGGSMDQQALLS